jgi:hypothetical protein
MPGKNKKPDFRPASRENKYQNFTAAAALSSERRRRLTPYITHGTLRFCISKTGIKYPSSETPHVTSVGDRIGNMEKPSRKLRNEVDFEGGAQEG